MLLEFPSFISIGYVICFQIKYSRVTVTLCNYREEFVFKSINNQLSILADCNLSFTRSLNASYLQMDE